MTKQYKLNIFDVLAQIDKGNMGYYDSLSVEEKKGFIPVVAHQWLVGHASEVRLEMLDVMVNTQIFQLYDNPGLIYKLMVASSDGTPKRYKYIKTKSKKPIPSLKVDIVARYYRVGKREAKEMMGVLTIDDIVEIAEELGEDKTVIKKLRK